MCDISKDRTSISLKPDGKKIFEIMTRKGLNPAKLETKIQLANMKETISARTIQKAIKSIPIKINSLMMIAIALDVELEEIIYPGQINNTKVHGWTKIENLSGDWEETSNGLRFKVWKLLLDIDNRLDRGKCYDITQLNNQEQRFFKWHFDRHYDTCKKISERFRFHPNIPINRMAYVDQASKLHWVIDEWIEGDTLDKKLIRDRALNDSLFAKVANGLAAGLKALHEMEVIVRELCPSSIIICNNDQQPVLTDFELAKFSDGRQTVSPSDWRTINPYRAPEVGVHRTLTVKVDSFSWAAILTHAATGKCASKQDEWSDILQHADLPKQLKEVAFRCFNKQYPDKRPTIDDIIKTLNETRNKHYV